MALPAGVALALGALALACVARPDPPPPPSLSATLGGCPICHIDVVEKRRGSKHERKGIGCITCHGTSQKHLEDENNEVKPDRAFAPADIDDFCAGCHLDTCPQSQAKQRRVPPKNCAACHGAHRARIPAR